MPASAGYGSTTPDTTTGAPPTTLLDERAPSELGCLAAPLGLSSEGMHALLASPELKQTRPPKSEDERYAHALDEGRARWEEMAAHYPAFVRALHSMDPCVRLPA